METVMGLRKSGNKVRVLHRRQILPDGTASCKGGSTTVEITTGDGRELSGTSRCRDDERFDRKIGLKIALGRALASGKETMEEKAVNYVMILEHENGHARHFGPIQDLRLAIRTAEAYFGYEHTPYTVSFVPMTEPLGSEFLESKKKDGEE